MRPSNVNEADEQRNVYLQKWAWKRDLEPLEISRDNAIVWKLTF